MGVLDGRVAIVTGAGRGFGRAIARHLAGAGAAVAVTARTASQLAETAALIEKEGGKVIAVPGDVTHRRDVEKVVAETEGKLGPVAILVNNAGVPDPFGPIGVVDPDHWWKTQEVHVRAPMLYISAVFPGMKQRHRGCIINISAKAAYVLAPNLSAYCLAKTAQNRMVEFIAAESGGEGIRAFAMDPGFVVTRLAEDTMNSPDAQRWLPEMVKHLRIRKTDKDAEGDLDRAGQRCVDLASGKYDALSGSFIEPHDDLDELLKRKLSETEAQEEP
jgi:NAD(P)-dependent dehydrogenase (short-subunit alcohol dehydrogenase family)